MIDAGDGTYTLSGDLGGFLIDPSSSTVTVNFLDENGVKLGTGTLQPVTAWDRLFSTGLHPPHRLWHDPGQHPQRPGGGDV